MAINEKIKKNSCVWGGKVIRSYPRDITIKATGAKRILHELIIACTQEAANHAYTVSKKELLADMSDGIDTLRISIWEDDPGYEAAKAAVAGGFIKVKTGKVTIDDEGYVHCSVKNFKYCADSTCNYYTMPELTERTANAFDMLVAAAAAKEAESEKIAKVAVVQ